MKPFDFEKASKKDRQVFKMKLASLRKDRSVIEGVKILQLQYGLLLKPALQLMRGEIDYPQS